MPKARNPRYRSFCFTLNLSDAKGDDNVAIDAGNKLHDHFYAEQSISRHMFQLERAPTTGMLHLQGMLSTIRVSSFDVVRGIFERLHKDLKPWIQEARDPASAWTYCQKDDTKVAGPWTKGKPPSQGMRTDLLDFIDAASDLKTGNSTIIDIRRDYPAIEARYMRYFDRVIFRNIPDRSYKTRVILCTGPPATGKSHTCRLESRNVFNVEPFSINLRDGVKGTTATNWYDGYDQHDGEGITAIIDELSPSQLPLSSFNQLGDRYPLNLPIKGGFVKFRAKALYITTNYPLVDLYPSLSRTDQGSMVSTGVVDGSFYSRVDEHWDTSYHDDHQPNADFSNRIECATYAKWTQVK